jgi:CRISPR/Cas system-associated endonuclease Cas3-HD
MNTINIKLYDTLRRELNLSEEKSRAITQAIEETLIEELKNTDRQTATKIDIEQLRSEIKETKAELLKWFVGLFITIMLMVLGLYATILLK